MRILLFFALALGALGLTTNAAEPAAQEAPFISNARALVFEGKRSGEGYFRPMRRN